jgi:predicted O-methyltransferase YrrM
VRPVRLTGALLFDSAPANRVLRRHRGRLLREALANGLSPALEEPLRWLAFGELAGGDRDRVERVERLRAELAAADDALPDLRGGETSLRRLAEVASVDRRFGTLLYLCAKATRAREMLELGSCLGVGTAYMASAGCERIVSVEASPERAAIARRTAASVSAAAEVVVGFFDEVLPGILAGLERGLDMAWIDGHHRKDATLSYLDAIRPRLNRGAVVAFDDIRWSAEMLEAWRVLQRADGFADTVDLGSIGLGLWRGEGAVPRVHDLRGIYGRPRWLRRRAERVAT